MNCNLFGFSENWMKYFGNQMKSMMCNSLVSLVYGNSYNTTLPLIIRYLLGYCDLIKEWYIYNEARISINQFEANIPYLFGSVFPHGNCKKKCLVIWSFFNATLLPFKKKNPHKYMTQNENHCNKNCNFLEKEIIVVGTSKIQRETVFMLNFLH